MISSDRFEALGSMDVLTRRSAGAKTTAGDIVILTRSLPWPWSGRSRTNPQRQVRSRLIFTPGATRCRPVTGATSTRRVRLQGVSQPKRARATSVTWTGYALHRVGALPRPAVTAAASRGTDRVWTYMEVWSHSVEVSPGAASCRVELTGPPNGCHAGLTRRAQLG
jgi:hypothetical protein